MSGQRRLISKMANEMVIDMKFKGDKNAIDSVDKAIDELDSSAKKASKDRKNKA